MRLGDVRLKVPLVLAPMAGVSGPTFRRLARNLGAGLAVGEMTSARGLLGGQGRTKSFLAIDPAEHPVALQLFGAEPAEMAEAARLLAAAGADVIDLNYGCPVPKVVASGAGSALLRDPDRAVAVAAAVVRAVDRPVTVKLRTGWQDAEPVLPELAERLADVGVAGLTVHGRSREAMYRGLADWDLIARVVRRLSIPVIGNGDILSGAEAVIRLRESGAAAVMIGRGALGNPWIFREAVAALNAWEAPPPTWVERRSLIEEHLAGLLLEHGPRAILEMRRHAAHYLRGFPGAAGYRERLHRVKSPAELRGVLDDIAAELQGASVDSPVNHGI